eukprot:NODE_3447_length_1349_cov_23.266721_g3009_i0.p1 GENE.NODE_3447_length_1349_cov_23.266721_g3009_i0~~NODE_3447_length_1349_cov_23.266721_g3009_i0.p1  ORF type:complete len:386 (+),score=81.51 NODE_3447_length_1349_cov_23.266721_g3009_i0:57-1160(+)
MSINYEDFIKGCFLPKDEQGYVKSFSLENLDEMKDFFNRYGVVVVSNVLSQEECKSTVDEIWSWLEKDYSVERNNPKTYNNWSWPHLTKFGILGSAPYLYPQGCRNRQNPNFYKVMTKIFDDEALWTAIERIGMLRPTVGVKIKREDGSEIIDEFPHWKSISEWLHMDMNPATGRATTFGFVPTCETQTEKSDIENFHITNSHNGLSCLKTQGFFALVDCPEEVGGFHCVPGFHQVIEKWTEKYKDHCLKSNSTMDPTTVQIPQEDTVTWSCVQRVPVRAGSLVIWDSRLPHGNFPNNCDKFRIVQYVRMLKASDPAVRPRIQAGALKQEEFTTIDQLGLGPISPDDMPSEFEYTELGRKLYGIDPW